MNEEYRIVNIEETAGRLNMDKSFIEKLIKKFLSSDMLVKTEESFNNDDIEGAKIAIHSIKGTAANVGLQGLSKLALDMETKIKEQNYLDKELLEVLKEIWNELSVKYN